VNDRKKNALISTFFRFTAPVTKGIQRIPVDKNLILYDPQITKKENFQELKNLLDGFEINYEIIHIPAYDIVQICKIVKNLIDDLHEKGYEITCNVTGGRKTIFAGVLYAAYQRIGKVKKLFYMAQETDAIIELPIVSWELKPKQRQILELFSKNPELKIEFFKSEVNLSKPMIYTHIKELKNLGLLTQITRARYEVSLAGKLILV